MLISEDTAALATLVASEAFPHRKRLRGFDKNRSEVEADIDWVIQRAAPVSARMKTFEHTER
jgi:hypothetical protein